MKKTLLILIAATGMAACQKSDNSAPVQTPAAATTTGDFQPEQIQDAPAPACVRGRHYPDRQHFCDDMQADLNYQACVSGEFVPYFEKVCGRRWQDGSSHHHEGPAPQDPHNPRDPRGRRDD